MSWDLLNSHNYFMQIAIKLAKKWYWKTGLNPLVWCVIVKNEKIIWKWYHKKFWWNHAEINVINSVKNKKDLIWSILYVTLEPCNHYGKTPPCTKAILESWIKDVIIWSLDPFNSKSIIANDSKAIQKMNKWLKHENNFNNWVKWIEFLKQHWIKTISWILKKECEEINKEFFAIHKEKRCFVIAKIASSLDWWIALKNWESKWITNELARKDGRKLRWEVDWILVWINTILKDDPLLTTRIKWNKNPVRIVLDPNFKISKNANVLNWDVKTIVFIQRHCEERSDVAIQWNEIITTNHYNWKFDLNDISKILYKKWIKKLLIEWGPSTITSFLKEWLIDKIIHYQSSQILWWDSVKMIWDLGLQNLEKSIKLKPVFTKKLWDDIRRDYEIICHSKLLSRECGNNPEFRK